MENTYRPMLLKEFPEINWLKHQIANNFSNKTAWNGDVLPSPGWPTVLVNVKTNQATREKIKGTFSLFSNTKGESLVSINNRTVRVAQDQFFLTNQEQNYSLYVDNQEQVETFNIHIGTDLVQNMYSAHNTRAMDLFDPMSNERSIEFHNTLHQKDQNFTHLFNKLHKCYEDNCGSTLQKDEVLDQIIAQLIFKETGLRSKYANLSSLKKSTRIALVKQLYIASDYMHSHYNRDLSLEELAQLVCLSKFHFLRLFKSMFHRSPHQYLTDIRLEKAKCMIRSTPCTMLEIAWNIGLENASSLTRLFNNRLGLSPQAYRQNFQK